MTKSPSSWSRNAHALREHGAERAGKSVAANPAVHSPLCSPIIRAMDGRVVEGVGSAGAKFGDVEILATTMKPRQTSLASDIAARADSPIHALASRCGRRWVT